MAEPTSCCVLPGSYFARVDTLFNMAGMHVLDMIWRERSRRIPAGRLLVETDLAGAGCPGCEVIAVGHGRRLRRLHDIPAFGALVELWWQQRRYRCLESACPIGGFSEDHLLAGPRAKLTTRAAWWAISCIQRDTASGAAVARRLGWTGTPCGTPSLRYSPNWPTTPTGSAASTRSASTSTSCATRRCCSGWR